MKQIPSKTTYLEMHTPPSTELRRPTDVDLQIQRLQQPTVEFYRFLYNSVGAQYYWVDRNLWPDDKLQALLQDPLVEIYLMQIDSQPIETPSATPPGHFSQPHARPPETPPRRRSANRRGTALGTSVSSSSASH